MSKFHASTLAAFAFLALLGDRPPPPPAICDALGTLVLLGGYRKVVDEVRQLAPSPACAKYAAGVALERLGAQAVPTGDDALRDAMKIFSQLAGGPAPLSEWARFHLAQTAYLASEPVSEKRLSVPATFAWRGRQAMLLAALKALKQPAEGAAALRQVSAKDREERQFQLELESGVGKRMLPPPEWLAEVQRELFVEFPRSKEAPLAFRDATLADLLRRAEVASEAHMNADVIKTVQAALTMKPNPGERCRLMFYKGAALRKQRKYAPAEETLEGARAMCQGARDVEFHKRAFYLLGQVQAIARPQAIAEATLVAFIAAFKTDPLVDDALFSLAVLAQKAGQRDKAEKYFSEAASLMPPGDQCAEARFRLAYAEYKRARYEGAAQRFAQLSEAVDCGDDYEHARALYWQARSLARLTPGQPEAAGQVLERLAARYPLSYYGLLARTRVHAGPVGEVGAAVAVGGVPSAASASTQPSASTSPVMQTPVGQRIVQLAQAGLFFEAQAEVRALAEARPEIDKLQLAKLLSLGKDYFHAHMMFRKELKSALGTVPAPETLEAWQLAYPRPFDEVVRAVEVREGLPPDFLLALMREESAFQLDAGSWANAYGLTQLLVETAQATAKDMKLAPPTAEDLQIDPELAIALGGHHLAMIKRRLPLLPLVLAAYNAGQGAVRRWVGAQGGLLLDEFIEEIPLDETRGYVKRILKTWFVYATMAGRPAPPLELDTPVSALL